MTIFINMEFRTIIEANKCTPFISHRNPVVMMGSCFTESIGQRLRNAMFDVTTNPWGVMYNPESIRKQLEYIILDKEADETRMFQQDGVWHSFDHHTSFSSREKSILSSKINEVNHTVHQKLKSASALIVTFGSATTFNLTTNGTVVGNCHKLPADRFYQQRIDLKEAISKWGKQLAALFEFNPQIKVIFTVSPIRYKAYGFHRSILDKSMLFLLVDSLEKEYGSEGGGRKVDYFPAYEIMMDDLRDYRFYAADMIHPSDVAVDYIYNIFSQQYFSDDTKKLAAKCEALTRRLNHRFMTDDRVLIERFNSETERIKAEINREIHNESSY